MTAAVSDRIRPSAHARSAPSRSSRADQSPRTVAIRNQRSHPTLKVLNQQAARQRARRRNALLGLFVIVLLGFFMVAFVHADLVAGQQELDALRNRIAEAEEYSAEVARQVEEASSPQVIVGRATEELGMVRAYRPVYLEAVAPLRSVPDVVALAPPRPAIAVDVAASAPQIAIGVSADGPAVITAGIASPQTAGADETADSVTATSSAVSSSVDAGAVDAGAVDAGAVQAPAEVNLVTTVGASAPVAAPQAQPRSSFQGVSISASGSAIAAPVAAAETVSQPARESNGRTGSSIAGSRAVAGGALAGGAVAGSETAGTGGG